MNIKNIYILKSSHILILHLINCTLAHNLDKSGCSKVRLTFYLTTWPTFRGQSTIAYMSELQLSRGETEQENKNQLKNKKRQTERYSACR